MITVCYQLNRPNDIQIISNTRIKSNSAIHKQFIKLVAKEGQLKKCTSRVFIEGQATQHATITYTESIALLKRNTSRLNQLSRFTSDLHQF